MNTETFTSWAAKNTGDIVNSMEPNTSTRFYGFKHGANMGMEYALNAATGAHAIAEVLFADYLASTDRPDPDGQDPALGPILSDVHRCGLFVGLRMLLQGIESRMTRIGYESEREHHARVAAAGDIGEMSPAARDAFLQSIRNYNDLLIAKGEPPLVIVDAPEIGAATGKVAPKRKKRA